MPKCQIGGGLSNIKVDLYAYSKKLSAIYIVNKFKRLSTVKLKRKLTDGDGQTEV